MNSKLYLSLLTSFVTLILLGCSSKDKEILQDVENMTTKKEVNFSIIDCTNLRSSLDEFANSHLKSTGVSTSFDDYDFSETAVLKFNSKDKAIYAVPKKENQTEFISFVQDQGITTAANIIKILEKNEDKIFFEYASIVGQGGVLLKGYIDIKLNTVELTFVDESLNGNTLKASAAGLGCNLGLWGAGASWGYAVGLINPVAGIAVGLAYTVAAYYACDGL